MIITNLKLENFKSFKSVEIDFKELTVIVGANASGKSNLISAYRFIKDCMTEGLDNAIALQGGINNLINSRAERESQLSVEFEVDFSKEGAVLNIRKEKFVLELQKMKYSFSIQPNKRGQNFKIVNDELNISYKSVEVIHGLYKKDNEYKDSNTMLHTRYIRKSNSSKPAFQHSFESLNDEPVVEIKSIKDQFIGGFFAELVAHNKKELMLHKVTLLLPRFFVGDDFINIYDFDPKMLKNSCSMISKKKLEENGSNMAAVLQTLLKSKENRKELTTLIKSALPFITSVGIQRNLDQSFSFKVKEQYSTKEFYANFLSDGTVSMLAIIIALYFEKDSSTIILEEPERNIHPALLQRVVEMAKDVSNNKQILITTHNAEIIKNIPLDTILFIKRSEDGNSEVIKPSTSATVACFIENELGLDELFVQNLLGE